MGRFLDLIYGEVKTVVAKKTRDHVHCDWHCRQAGHRYIHEFKSAARMQGIPDGSFIMLADGRSFRLSNGSILISDREY